MALALIFTVHCDAGVEVQYSLDHGETWSLLQAECMMGKNIACESYTAASVLSSDVFYDWTRVAIKLPYYTRSEHHQYLNDAAAAARAKVQ